MTDRTVIERAAIWAGIDIDDAATERLTRYGRWLVEEAMPAGGIGPSEHASVARRHIADSLTLGIAWRDRVQPRRVADLGSGVGLPGIPLAITHRSTRFLLIDRSGRRCRLMRRAQRILRLENIEVVQTDVGSPIGAHDAVVSRALKEPGLLRETVVRWLGPGGVAAIAGSRTRRPEIDGFETIAVPPGILDHPAWILIMGPLQQEDAWTNQDTR